MAQARSRKPDDDPGAYLGRALEGLRLKAGFATQEQLADALGLSRSRVTKAETGESPPDLEMLKLWLQKTRAHPDFAARLVCELARHRENSGPVWFRDYPEAEGQAHAIRIWHPMIFPGLVQTVPYASALLRVMGSDEETVQAYLDLRLRRQAVLDRSSPPELHMVVDESVLRRLVGAREVMDEQVTRILELATRSNVIYQVVPSSGGVSAGHGGALTILSVNQRPDVVLNEASVQDFLLVRPHQSVMGRRIWERVLSAALPSAASIDLTREVASQWK